MRAGDNYQLVHAAVYEGQSVVNVYHFIQIGADGTGDPRQSLSDIFNVQIWPLIQTQLIDEFVQLGYRTKGIIPNETQTLLNVVAATGDLTDDGLPPNSVMQLTNYGSPLGRKGTGRTLLTGLPEANATDGVWDLTQQAAFAAYATLMTAPVIDGVTSWSFQFGILDTDLNVIRPVQRIEVAPRVKTLRSRTIGASGA